MKAVILAAGEGTRMRPLTADTPKPLLPVAGEPLIQQSIDQLEEFMDEIIIVTGYLSEQFVELYGEKENITIVEQDEQLGTGDALLAAKEHVDGRFMILNGDDVYTRLEECLKYDFVAVAGRVEDPENFGVYELERSIPVGINEKPDEPESNLVNAGCFILDAAIFDKLEKTERSERGEIELTDALSEYMRDNHFEMVVDEEWRPCSYPWQLLDANKELIEKIGGRIDGKVADDVDIVGDVIIEEEAVVKSGTVIEGPAIIKEGSIIGPNTHIRSGSFIGKNVEVKNSEIKNSILMENSAVPHFNYVGDSVIGKKANLGAGTKIANVRNDDQKISFDVGGELMDTGRKKLGAVIGSETRIGVNCSIKPGRKIGYRAGIDCHEKVEQTVPDNSILKDGEIIEDRN